MPSLIDPSKANGVVNVAANYLKMPAHGTYGVGTVYTNFATRQLRFVKVIATQNATAVDFTKDTGLAGGTAYTVEGTGYRAAGSVFSNAVRAIQLVGEVYFISEPNATGFVIAVAEDTVNDSDVGSNDPTGYGDVEAAIKAGLEKSGLTVVVVTASTFALAA
jgi:hypothetical protein